MKNMMLQVKSYKTLVLAALLIGAAGKLFASGLFSISTTGQVRFADENLKVEEKEHFQWSELNGASSVVPVGQRVLTHDEWLYLFESRTNAYSLYALAAVDSENGLVILPDEDTWVLPDGLTFNYYNTEDGYSKNNYSAAEWSRMAEAGAIFLPCRGYLSDGTTIEDEAIHGSYWTSSVYAENDPYCIQFDDSYFYAETHNSAAGSAYRSVRTVTDVAEPTPTDIDNTQRDNVQCSKVIQNGQLYLMYEGTMIDVRGNKFIVK